MVFNAPAQVTLAGHDGDLAQYMGVYELNGEVVHDGPLYVQSRGLENAVAGLILRRRGPRAGLHGSKPARRRPSRLYTSGILVVWSSPDLYKITGLGGPSPGGL